MKRVFVGALMIGLGLGMAAPAFAGDQFVVGDYVYSPQIYDQLSASGTADGGLRLKAAAEFPLFNIPWLISADYSSAYAPQLKPPVSEAEAHVGLKLPAPQLFVGIGYLYRAATSGLGTQNALGIGIEKLPGLRQAFSLYGSAYYFPNVQTNFSDPSGTQFSLQYKILKYNVGGTLNVGRSPWFLDFGYLGDNANSPATAPGVSRNGPYAGLGIHF